MANASEVAVGNADRPIAPGATGVTAQPPSAHAEPVEALLERLRADPVRGLSSKDAEERLARDGANELPPPAKPSALKRFLAQFANPIVLTLLAAAVIAVVDGVEPQRASRCSSASATRSRSCSSSS